MKRGQQIRIVTKIYIFLPLFLWNLSAYSTKLKFLNNNRNIGFHIAFTFYYVCISMCLCNYVVQKVKDRKTIPQNSGYTHLNNTLQVSLRILPVMLSMIRSKIKHLPKRKFAQQGVR